MSLIYPSTKRAFDTGVVTIDSSSSWVEVGRLALKRAFSGLLLDGVVGAGGDIAHLKLTWASVTNGTHRDFYVDSDFATRTEIEVFATATPYTTAAGGNFQIKLSRLDGVAEIGVWAKKASADTTVRITA